MYVYIYMYIYIDIYNYTYIYIYIHTYIYILPLWNYGSACGTLACRDSLGGWLLRSRARVSLKLCGELEEVWDLARVSIAVPFWGYLYTKMNYIGDCR